MWLKMVSHVFTSENGISGQQSRGYSGAVCTWGMQALIFCDIETGKAGMPLRTVNRGGVFPLVPLLLEMYSLPNSQFGSSPHSISLNHLATLAGAGL